mmetsp:Transcript_24230/g.43743  ORF Transcript_24230/g.43743 Transcript_24230/m.43743 type:complete len:359 (-) Transcript_24230:72-1148(-)
MPLHVLPLLKSAIVMGGSLGLINSKVSTYKYRKKTRNMVEEDVEFVPSSWDPRGSANWAVTGAVLAPFVSAPLLVLRDFHGWNTLGLAAASVALTELAMLPLSYTVFTGQTRKLKVHLPWTVAVVGTGTVTLSAALALGLRHWVGGTLSSFGVLMPEQAVFTSGLCVTSFLYYCFVEDQVLTLSMVLPDRKMTHTAASITGHLGAAGLFTLAFFPITDPFSTPRMLVWGENASTYLHFLGAQSFFLTMPIFHIILTYAHSATSSEDAERTWPRAAANGLTLVGLFLSGKAVRQQRMMAALGLQTVAMLAWLSHLLSFDGPPPLRPPTTSARKSPAMQPSPPQGPKEPDTPNSPRRAED